MTDLKSKSERRYELDWLKVLVILNLIPFHAAWLITYIPGFSQVPQERLVTSVARYYISFVAYWQMPVLFFVAGTTACLSLSYRSTTEYIKELPA